MKLEQQMLCWCATNWQRTPTDQCRSSHYTEHSLLFCSFILYRNFHFYVCFFCLPVVSGSFSYAFTFYDIKIVTWVIQMTHNVSIWVYKRYYPGKEKLYNHLLQYLYKKLLLNNSFIKVCFLKDHIWMFLTYSLFFI